MLVIWLAMILLLTAKGGFHVEGGGLAHLLPDETKPSALSRARSKLEGTTIFGYLDYTDGRLLTSMDVRSSTHGDIWKE